MWNIEWEKGDVIYMGCVAIFGSGFTMAMITIGRMFL